LSGISTHRLKVVDGGELYNSKPPFEDEQKMNNNPQGYPQVRNKCLFVDNSSPLVYRAGYKDVCGEIVHPAINP
jgi:hypothetical protein